MRKSIKRKRQMGKLLTYLCLLVGVIFAGFPILWLISTSIRANGEVFSVPPHIIPKQFTMSAYVKILTTSSKMRFFFNSYFVAIIVTLLTLTISILASYGFSRYNFRGKRIMNMFIVGTQTVPAITLMIPYFGMMVSWHVYDSYFALIITYLAKTLPFSILLMTGYMNTLPKELDESVLVDGGSRLLALTRILVPISIPGIVSTGLYVFLQAWNEYLYALTLIKSTELSTVPIGIARLMGQHSYEWNEMLAMSVLGSLPIALLFLFFQKYFLSGMSAGSVKG